MLTYKELSVQEAEEVYDKYLVEDFPPLEVKPFKTIARLMQEGCYRCLGFYEEEEIVGYAFFCDHKEKQYSLWDYFAIRKDLRGKGYGQRVIAMLREIHKDFQAVLLESEDPAHAEDEQQLNVRTRRVHFYERCGVVNTGLTSNVFDVDYLVLALECKASPDLAVVRKYYREIYQDLVTEPHFTQRVHIG